jgi:hypothetical protein
MDAASIANIKLALKVLAQRYHIEEHPPTVAEIEALKSLLGPAANTTALDDLACEVIQRELDKKAHRKGA